MGELGNIYTRSVKGRKLEWHSEKQADLRRSIWGWSSYRKVLDREANKRQETSGAVIAEMMSQRRKGEIRLMEAQRQKDPCSYTEAWGWRGES